MGRGSKPVAVLREEKKSHRTKAELEQREKTEKELLSGAPLFFREDVKKDAVANKEFKRLKKLLTAIKKNDALYAPDINRYCMLYSEEQRLRQMQQKVELMIDTLSEKFDEVKDELDAESIAGFAGTLLKLLKELKDTDGLIMSKRTMQRKIENDNCMNVAAALRTIPKEAAKEEKDELLTILGGGS